MTDFRNVFKIADNPRTRAWGIAGADAVIGAEVANGTYVASVLKNGVPYDQYTLVDSDFALERNSPRLSGEITRLKIMWFLKDYACDHGYAPSVREIRDAVGLASINSVYNQLKQLEKRGAIRRDPCVARSIVIVERS